MMTSCMAFMMSFLALMTASSLVGYASAEAASPCPYSNDLRNLQCSWLHQQISNPNCSVLGTCFCGNQLLDPSTLGIISSATVQSGRIKRSMINFASIPLKKWTLPVPYAFNGSIDQDAKKLALRQAVSHIQAQTCIRFTEVSNPTAQLTSYISIELSTSCVSFNGQSLNQTTTPIFANTDCLSKFGEMLYYVAQTLGMWHESQRQDSPSYITIVLANIDSVHQADLIPLPAAVQNTYGLPYDYASVMHFPGTVYLNSGNFTILTTDPLYEHTIGQRVQLSFQDAKILNFAYCNGSCGANQTSAPCLNGGYQDPNNCLICKCPDGYAGSDCSGVETATGGVCGGPLIAGVVEGNFSSPGYFTLQYYPEQVACTWQIKAVSGNIKLRFVGDFGLYCVSYACYHWVEIRYKGQMNITGPRFCCQSLPTDVLISDGQEVRVIFRSNATIGTSQRRGFQIAYSAVNVATCSSITCQNGGTCVNGLCTCLSGFSGVNCQIDSCANITCLNGGVCTNGFCICPAGYTGITCQTSITPSACSPNPCHNNGTCSVVNGIAVCTCPAPFFGLYCQTAGCGACSVGPGVLQPMCMATANPIRQCVRQSSYWGCSGYGRRSYCSYITYNETYNCYSMACCDNAVQYDNSTCGVLGWSTYSTCSAVCGGGVQIKYNYVNKTLPNGLQTIAAVDNVTTPCNTQACPCDLGTQRCSFQVGGSTCLPPNPFDRSSPYFCDRQQLCQPRGGRGGGGRRGGSSSSDSRGRGHGIFGFPFPVFG